MEEEKGSIFDWTRSLITVAIIIVTAIVVGGGVYLFMSGYENSYKKTTDNEIAALEKQLANLRSQVALDKSTNSDNSALGTDWKLYSNSKYGFTLTFPDDWKGYQVTPVSDTSIGSLKYQDGYEFSLTAPKTSEKVTFFTIQVYRTTDYSTLLAKAGGALPNSEVIGKSGGYSFISTRRLDANPDWGFPSTLSSSKVITDTFKSN